MVTGAIWALCARCIVEADWPAVGIEQHDVARISFSISSREIMAAW